MCGVIRHDKLRLPTRYQNQMGLSFSSDQIGRFEQQTLGTLQCFEVFTALRILGFKSVSVSSWRSTNSKEGRATPLHLYKWFWSAACPVNGRKGMSHARELRQEPGKIGSEQLTSLTEGWFASSPVRSDRRLRHLTEKSKAQ